MTIKIEAGKYYRTRDGKKRGPAVYDFNDLANLPWNVPNEYGDHWYDIYGVSCTGSTNNDLVAEWTDTPKLWRDMTPEEKGALLLAHHEGKMIEAKGRSYDWMSADYPRWSNDTAYRTRPESVRETVTLHGAVQTGWCFEPYQADFDTHRITFDLIDGKPDCASIRMEEL